ncbi:hypothetical protein GCM10017786_23060 [Amycolatopsis deserti]|uniref:Uncharacterized protein n=1 Tax=Amycolatopsis deserti TaxID=185696 RepID=A0ABQ3IRG5_9PSEU|nr:hypothetical protein GCM10017786_23060 [Amycolatopsis deserti]
MLARCPRTPVPRSTSAAIASAQARARAAGSPLSGLISPPPDHGIHHPIPRDAFPSGAAIATGRRSPPPGAAAEDSADRVPSQPRSASRWGRHSYILPSCPAKPPDL